MKKHIPMLALAVAALAVSAGTAAAQVAAKTSYAKDVQPIFDAHCVECHKPGGEGFMASGLDLSTYEGAMKGTQHGAIISAGDPLTSNLMAVLEGRTDASIRMPHSKRRDMTKDDRTILRRWIVDGATEDGYNKTGVTQVFADLCIDCHQPGGMGFEASGLDLRTYESVMKGTQHGSVVVPGDPVTSNLMVLVEGRADGMLKMPHNEQTSPSAQERTTLRRWIQQGAKND